MVLFQVPAFNRVYTPLEPISTHMQFSLTSSIYFFWAPLDLLGYGFNAGMGAGSPCSVPLSALAEGGMGEELEERVQWLC